MEPLQPQVVNGPSAFGSRLATGSHSLGRGAVFLALPLLTLVAGCVTLGSFSSLAEGTSSEVPCQVVAAWHNAVVFTPDPTHNGVPTPGMAGRLYLFGPEIKNPLLADGSLIVDLYDDTLVPAGRPPVLLEEWRIDKDTLKRLARRDAVGWGYTLFLPWGTYRPEIKQVHLRVRYDPPKGTPLYTEGAPLTLNQDEAAPPAAVNPAVFPSMGQGGLPLGVNPPGSTPLGQGGLPPEVNPARFTPMAQGGLPAGMPPARFPQTGQGGLPPGVNPAGFPPMGQGGPPFRR